MSDEIAVLLVDDQELVRSGLRRILRRKVGFVIVAECCDGDEVMAAVEAHRPDVVVMDLRMKRVDGIEATRRLNAGGGPPVLILTTFNEDELISSALRSGAAGFVLKNSTAEELIRAVTAVAQGEGYLDPAVTTQVLRGYRQTATAHSVPVEALTSREVEVLQLVASGRSNTEIAEHLGISELTVKTHLGRILHKLQLRDRAAAIVYAYDHDIVLPRRARSGR
ncbi:response regulator transcription factor [Mycolicibacterium palauense]|uniref:response regulator transcription factor n=1 Tax=Mycolicibacterium palauense TaxID=2034511 RepID=UPI000BFF0355|nr:response regulator transcription factor [Mycolicibacterium palauense]